MPARRALLRVFAVVFAICACAVACRAQSEMAQPARAELNLGVDAYKAARYDEAIAHFRKAAELAPDLTVAKLYLATALAQNVVPGLDTPDNLAAAQQAIDVFQQVLSAQPHDINSQKQVAAVYFSIKKLDEAREWQKKVLIEDPKDPEAAYTIGVIDWAQAHQNALKALIPAGVNDDGEGNAHAPAYVLSKIRAQNKPLVDEGLHYLELAIANRPNYDDAMAYLNLMYRRKADLDFENPKARDQDVAAAGEWAQKAMVTRKANVEKEAQGAASPQP